MLFVTHDISEWYSGFKGNGFWTSAQGSEFTLCVHMHMHKLNCNSRPLDYFYHHKISTKLLHSSIYTVGCTFNIMKYTCKAIYAYLSGLIFYIDCTFSLKYNAI